MADPPYIPPEKQNKKDECIECYHCGQKSYTRYCMDYTKPINRMIPSGRSMEQQHRVWKHSITKDVWSKPLEQSKSANSNTTGKTTANATTKKEDGKKESEKSSCILM